MDDFFDRIFVINLDSRSDRWEFMQKQLNEMKICNYERVSAFRPSIDQVKTQYPHFYHYFTKDNKQTPDHYMVGALGCKLSHYSIIREAKKRGYKRILILEDDCAFQPYAQKMFKLLTDYMTKYNHHRVFDWKMLYFTGNNVRSSIFIENFKHLKKCVRTLSTCAYALDASIFDEMLENMMKYPAEVDTYYADRIQPRFHCLSFAPHICYQRADVSDILGCKVDYEKSFKANI